MKKIFYVLVIIAFFNACVEEYNRFYPYKNIEISYLDKLQKPYEKIAFDNNEGTEILTPTGLLITVFPGTFAESDTITMNLKEIITPKDILTGRYSMLDPSSKRCFTTGRIIDFNLKNPEAQPVRFNKYKFILFKIPHEGYENPTVYVPGEYGYWKIPGEDDYVIKRGSWEIVKDGQLTTVKGFIIKTQRTNAFCLGKTLPEGEINDLQVRLTKGFDVKNSVVQLYNKEYQTNIEMFWDKEENSFVLPEGISFPGGETAIVVFAEKYGSQPFFGIKYADIKNKDIIEVEVKKITTEEILDSLQKL